MAKNQSYIKDIILIFCTIFLEIKTRYTTDNSRCLCLGLMKAYINMIGFFGKKGLSASRLICDTIITFVNYIQKSLFAPNRLLNM